MNHFFYISNLNGVSAACVYVEPGRKKNKGNPFFRLTEFLY